jgi:hypothetical protein
MSKSNNIIYHNFSTIISKKNKTLRDDLDKLITSIENLLEQTRNNIGFIQQQIPCFSITALRLSSEKFVSLLTLTH